MPPGLLGSPGAAPEASWGPLGLAGVSLGFPWLLLVPLGASWRSLGASWGSHWLILAHLERSLTGLGIVFGPLGRKMALARAGA